MIPRTIPGRSCWRNWFRLQCWLRACPTAGVMVDNQRWLACTRCFDLRERLTP